MRGGKELSTKMLRRLVLHIGLFVQGRAQGERMAPSNVILA